MILKLAVSLLLICNIANGAMLRESVVDDVPEFSMFSCEADLCVRVTYADGSADTIETTQEKINGEKVNVYKGKVWSTGAKAVIIPKDNDGVNSEDLVVFHSGKSGECTKFSVDLANTGKAECLNHEPHPLEGANEDEFRLDIPTEERSMYRTPEEIELAPRALDPNGYKLKVAVYYDDSFAEQFKGGAVSRAAALMAMVDEMYSEKDSLKTEIDVITVSIEHLEGENWGYTNTWTPLFPKFMSFSASRLEHNGADLNVYLVGTGTVVTKYRLPNLGPLGVACSHQKALKWSLTTYADGKGADAYTATKIAHEIGHNLGIEHDCIGGCCAWWNPNVYKGPRVLDGKECFGYMDYNGTTNYWSHCSVADLNTYINRVPEFCLEKIIPDRPVEHADCHWKLVELHTKSKASEIQWALGKTCVSDVDGPMSDPTYQQKKEEYDNNERFSQWCCMPGYGDYELRCINTLQQKRYAGNYNVMSGDGWHGAYIEIDGQKYCEDFKEGDLQIETVSYPEPPIPPGLENCPLPQRDWVGNGMCEDEPNTKECQWDGGDCCDNKSGNGYAYCDECECFGTSDFPTN